MSNNIIDAVTQTVNSLVSALKLPDESAKANDTLGSMNFPQFSRILPYKDYDSATGLFINNKTVGFMFEARPLPGADKSIVATLEHLLRSKLPRGVPVSFHLVSSKLVGNDIDYGLREFRWSGKQAKKFNAITRAYYLRAAETQFPLPDNLDLPLTLRNYRVYISCCVPRKKNSATQIVEMENQIKILRASLGGAYIPTRILDAAGLVELMRELINPDPHEMYRVPYKLDPYQDLNYQCVDDSFDMKVTAGHLKIGRLGRDGKECVTRVTSYHLEKDPEMAFLWSNADNYANLLNPELSISCPFVITLTLMVEDQVKTQNEANLKFMDVEKKSKTSYAKYFPNVIKEMQEWGDNATLNQLAQSGSHLRLYSAQDAARTTEKLSRHTAFSVVSEQLKSRSGETDLDAAIAQQKAGLHTPAEQAIHLAIPLLESQDLTFSRPQLLATAMETGGGKVSMADIDTTIQAQIRSGQLLNVPVAPGRGNDLLISRQAWDAEKSILTRVLEGKDAVAPLMDRVPDSLMTELTAGQRAATRMILESTDRFTVVQGYAGVGKTTQFRAVMSAISLLPEETRPRVIGLAPTHRAVGEMQSAGVDARTTASFLHDTQLLQRNGQTPDFSNTLFLLDESSMVGLADMAKAHSLIAAGGGRAVPSGDTDQLPPIASGQPFRLTQQRSAADVAIMKEIVRQVPELRPAVYSLIERDVHRALTTIEQVTPEQVPRKEGAWAPGSSVVEFTQKQEKEIEKALSEGKTLPEGQPATLYEALVKDYTGRTPEAQSQTLVITHLNKDRRALNSLIHDARRENGETGKEEITLPVLVTSNIRDGELRKLSTWTAHKEAVALVDNVYHRISKVDKDNQLITLTDSEGKERFISPREASAEGVTLYRQEKITVSQGDRMRFSKSDPEHLAVLGIVVSM